MVLWEQSSGKIKGAVFIIFIYLIGRPCARALSHISKHRRVSTFSLVLKKYVQSSVTQLNRAITLKNNVKLIIIIKIKQNNYGTVNNYISCTYNIKLLSDQDNSAHGCDQFVFI